MLRRLAPLLAPLVVIAAYVRVLGAPFVWDDLHLIVGAPSVTKLQPLATYFGSAFWQSPETGDLRGYYRPLTILSFAIDHAIHGDNPAGFHLTNLALHATNVVLLYFLMRKHRLAPAYAFALGTLWGILPRLTEAAAWIAGRTDVLATLFVLVALLVHRPDRVARVVLASIVVTIGLFAKEIALAGSVAICAIEIARGGSSLARRAVLAALPIALALAFVALRQHVIAERAPLHALSIGARAALALAAVGEYARMIAFPWRPELQIGIGVAPSAWMTALGAIVAIALGAFVYARRDLFLARRANVQSLVVIGSALAATGFALVLHVVPIAINVVAADRFLYLPSAGLALALAPCVEAARAKRGAKGLVALALGVTLFVATFLRVGDWCSEIDLWADAYARTPRRNAVPLNELGNVYFRAGLYKQAATIYGRAIPNGVLDPKSAITNHANSIAQEGVYDESARELGALCDAYPTIADHCLYAGIAELRRARFDAARDRIREALARLGGNYPDATQALGIVSRAEALSKTAPPDDPVARAVFAFRLATYTGRRPDALASAEEVLRAPSAPRAARRDAAEYWARFGPPEDLARVLEDRAASDVVDASMLEATRLRALTARELMAKWPSLGF